MAKKLFDYVIGNPPYQGNTLGDNKNFAPPVYHLFMDAAYEAGEKVEMITPGRFLFNAGSTPKAWNEKMLRDPHLKVMHYETNSRKVFPNTDIKGGIAVTYRDADATFGAIDVFTAYDELRSIKDKIRPLVEKTNLTDIVFSSESYHFTKQMHKEHPEVRHKEGGQGILSRGHDFDLKSNVLEKLSGIVFLIVAQLTLPRLKTWDS